MSETKVTSKALAPQSFLMWVGKAHYPTIESYVNEAAAQGISKRVANPDVAAKLAAPGTLIYLAHDEGDRIECEHCITKIENPEHRKAHQALSAAEAEASKRAGDYANAEDKLAGAEEGDTSDEQEEVVQAAKENLARAGRLLNNAIDKVNNLRAIRESTDLVIEAGSGGHVTLTNGDTWDYRRYMYWRNQPKKWSVDNVAKDGVHMCPHCGGFGQLPKGRVFGVFMPEQPEYCLKAEDGEKVQAELEAKGITVVTSEVLMSEGKRGCGKRQEGGSYVVTTKSEATPEQLTEAIKDLAAKGIINPEDVKVNGSFIEFIAPVDITGEKRFRGIKNWTPTAAAADEGEMITDSLAS